MIEPLVLLGEPRHLGSQHRLLMLQPAAIGGEPNVLLGSGDDQSLEALHVVGEVVENEVNGLSFPQVPESIVIFGLGYGIERLGEIAWLRSRAVYYWGDIDTHGFAILDRLRFGVPHAQSFLMDKRTLMEHRGQWAKEDSVHDGLVQRLTSTERELYDELKANHLGDGVRLEQERIGFAWLRNALRAVS